MLVITPEERTRVLAEIDKCRAEIHQEVLEIFRGFVMVAYDSVLDKTPQWTGHAAAQWNIGRNILDVSQSYTFAEENLRVSEEIRDRSGAGGLPAAKQVRHPEAIAEAKNRQAGTVEQIKLGDMIYISNNVESLLTEAYAAKLEENPNNYLRPENEGGHMVLKTLEWFNTRLAVVDPVAQISLRMVKLSDSGVMDTL